MMDYTNNNNCRRIIKTIYSQLSSIVSFACIFLMTSVYRSLSWKRSVPAGAWLVLVVMVTSLFLFFVFFRDDCKSAIDKIIHVDIRIILIISVSVIVRLPMIQAIQKWDAGAYYSGIARACSSFDFSFSGIIDSFRLCGHPAIMYTFFTIIGEFITPGDSYGVNLVTIIMTAAALVCLYNILAHLLPDTNKNLAMFSIMVVQFVPLFWGTATYVIVDYMLIIFFIYMWYSHINKHYLLVFFWMICVMLTKETGYMIVAGYFLVYTIQVLYRSFHKQSIGNGVKAFFADPIIIVLFVGAILMGGYFFIQGGLSSWGSATRFVDYATIQQYGTGVYGFGIYPKYIACKFIHWFMYGFNWIATLTIVICLYVNWKRHRLFKDLLNQLAPAIGSVILFCIFSMLYITWALNRYNIFFDVMLWFFCVLFVCFTFGRNIKYVGVYYSVISALLIVQTFYYIDPMANVIFNSYDTGRGRILATDMKKDWYGDALVNSYRYAYMDKLYDEMLDQAHYSEGTYVMELTNSPFTIDMCGYFDYALGWEAAKHRRVVITPERENNSGIARIRFLKSTDTIPKDADRVIAYYVEDSGMDETMIIAKVGDGFDNRESQELSNWGGKLTYYTLERMETEQ